MSKRAEQLSAVNDRLHAMLETIEAEMVKAEQHGETTVARKIGKAAEVFANA